MKHTLAMVLAGGRGTRMDILCRERPKPVLPFAGDKRVIDFTFSNCLHSKIRDIAVITDYERSTMAEYAWRWFMINGSSCNVEYLDPGYSSYSGTADAVYRNIDYLRNHTGDLVLILAGDHIYKMDYRDIISFHRECGGDATVGVITVPEEEAHRFGIVTTDESGRITDFIEKPEMPPSNFVSMGIYVFNKQVLIRRLIEDAENAQSPHDFGHAVIPEMVKRNRVFAWSFSGYWRDIGNPDAYFEASRDLLCPEPEMVLEDAWPVLDTSSTATPPIEYKPGHIKNSLVSPGCFVRGRVENSILSPGVCIEKGAEVTDSIIMSSSRIGNRSVINNCIIDESVNVGHNSWLGFEGTNPPEDAAALTILGSGVIIPAYTTVFRASTIPPHTGGDEFKQKVVFPMNVPRRNEYAGINGR